MELFSAILCEITTSTILESILNNLMCYNVNHIHNEMWQIYDELFPELDTRLKYNIRNVQHHNVHELDFHIIEQNTYCRLNTIIW